MDSDAYLLQQLEQWGYTPEERPRHAYLAYCGLEQPFTYVLAHGVVKTSIVLKKRQGVQHRLPERPVADLAFAGRGVHLHQRALQHPGGERHRHLL